MGRCSLHSSWVVLSLFNSDSCHAPVDERATPQLSPGSVVQRVSKAAIAPFHSIVPIRLASCIHYTPICQNQPPEMNVSKMIWAPLKKSPNWASQRGSNLGLSMLIPYSNPRTASSDNGLLLTWCKGREERHCHGREMATWVTKGKRFTFMQTRGRKGRERSFVFSSLYMPLGKSPLWVMHMGKLEQKEEDVKDVRIWALKIFFKD